MYIVPNIVTTANMFCGFYSMVASIQQEYLLAAWAILAAAVFDMLDGRIARLAKATSQFGVEYDSLSDLTSFGVAPAVLLYLFALQPFGRLGWAAAFLFLACGALRLARFNVNSAALPKGFFQGLPIPMGAGIVATFVIFCEAIGWTDTQFVMLVLSFVMAGLMVSGVRFPSFKEMNWRSRASFGYLMAGVVAMILIAIKPEITLFLLLSGYVVISLLWNAWSLFRKPQAPVSGEL
ncbi:MAG: CDP-diacylglycerol--serine O-phosphatidyltransferase [Oligoflexia bacterium]|nr:CDP-diacylglycerol--serine O-phosphatidyltransferase [Oligoflexia bacterium]